MLLQSDADVWNMWKKYFQYIVSIVLSVLAVAVLVAIISLAYILCKPESFFVTFSNLVFIAGGIILTFGALVEFFVRSHSHEIARGLFKPYHVLQNYVHLPESGMEKIETDEDRTSGGWMLIFIGALAIAISCISAFIGMK